MVVAYLNSKWIAAVVVVAVAVAAVGAVVVCCGCVYDGRESTVFAAKRRGHVDLCSLLFDVSHYV